MSIIQTTIDPSTRPTRPTVGDIGARLAGLGALTFAAVVVLQNLLRGATAPANGATSDEVLAGYADHRAVTFVLVATFVVSGVGLAAFLGGAMRRMLASSRSGWAFTGLVGATGIMTLFAVLVACEEALSAIASGSQPDSGAISAIWALHNCVFAVLFLSIAVALVGLSRAGVAAGITPAVFDRLGPIGAALLAVATLAGPAIAIGDAMPMFGLGAIGFLTWLAFLVTTGLRLVRSDATEIASDRLAVAA